MKQIHNKKSINLLLLKKYNQYKNNHQNNNQKHSYGIKLIIYISAITVESIYIQQKENKKLPSICFKLI